MIKLRTLIFFLLLGLSPAVNSQNIQSLSDIMGGDYPENIATGSSYGEIFLDTLGQKQLFQIRNSNTNDTYYLITDGTAEGSSFYGQLDAVYDWYKDGEHFSFYRRFPEEPTVLQLFKYDPMSNTLQLSNSQDLSLNNFSQLVSLGNNQAALFRYSNSEDEYKLAIIEPEGDAFSITSEVTIPMKQFIYHTFISEDEFFFLGNDDNGDINFSKFNINTLEATNYGVIKENTSVNSVAIVGNVQSDRLEAVIIGNGEEITPVIFDKEQETLTVLDDLPDYGPFGAPSPSFIAANDDFFIYNNETGNIEHYNATTNEYLSIPYPNRGNIKYDGPIRDFLVKGDTILFSKNVTALGWNEYFYFNRENNELEIIIDDYYENNGYGNRGTGMILFEDQILLGYRFGFNDCAIMFLEDDLTEHFLFDLSNPDYCVGNLMVNDDYVIFRTSQLLVLDRDEDEDGSDVWDDCDDTDPLINPNAEEIEGNDIDENCDGLLTNSFELAANAYSIIIAPNPAKSVLNISLNLLPSFTDASLQLSNLSGQIFWESELSILPNQQNIVISTEDLAAGSYILTVKSDKQWVSKKVVILK